MMLMPGPQPRKLWPWVQRCSGAPDDTPCSQGPDRASAPLPGQFYLPLTLPFFWAEAEGEVREKVARSTCPSKM